MAEGFLGRWSQRKQALREGKPVEEPPAPIAELPVAKAPAQAAVSTPQIPSEPVAPPPTLQDVQALTPQSDFQRFVARDVDPEVKHAAMRKLFSDPHFNVMDGMDVYIDDYNTPNPMPASMLRKMASAHFLGLVEEEKEPVPATVAQPVRETASPAPEAVATGTEARPAPDPEEVSEEKTHHDHPDQRLQQDHAAGPQGSGRGAG
ncbi:MAG: DUF3306 domain-containing protein [Curvibacter sp.]